MFGRRLLHFGIASVFGAGAVVGTAHASDDALHAPSYPWNHMSPLSAFDHARCIFIFFCKNPFYFA